MRLCSVYLQASTQQCLTPHSRSSTAIVGEASLAIWVHSVCNRDVGIGRSSFPSLPEAGREHFWTEEYRRPA